MYSFILNRSGGNKLLSVICHYKCITFPEKTANIVRYFLLFLICFNYKSKSLVGLKPKRVRIVDEEVIFKHKSIIISKIILFLTTK